MTYQVGLHRSSAGRIAFALFATLAIFMVFAFTNARIVSADGAGSPDECLGGATVTGSIQGTDDEVTFTAPDGQVVSGVCIKSGQLHTAPLTDADSNDCYTISGVGTDTVTVTRIGDGPDCQAISHVDATLTSAPGDDDDDDDVDYVADDDDDTGDDDDDDTGDDDDDTSGGTPPRGGTAGGNPPSPNTAMEPPSDPVIPMLGGLFALAAFAGLTVLRLARRS